MGELNGRVAIVSGSASGIGAAIVARLQSEGARVAGLDLQPGAAGDLELIVDLRADAQVPDAAARAAAALGPPDILVHAAAASFFGGCLDTDAATFLDLYDVNVGGAVRLLQACTPAMRGRGGSIVMLSSINARFATPTLAAYAATKAALENLVKTAAVELAGDSIRVNAIAPASIDTPAMQASFDRHGDPQAARIRNAARHPIERLGTSEEVAELALFLASDRSKWITGAVFPIDGGASVTRR